MVIVGDVVGRISLVGLVASEGEVTGNDEGVEGDSTDGEEAVGTTMAVGEIDDGMSTWTAGLPVLREGVVVGVVVDCCLHAQS
mmetsp:Transcript_6310/g.10475  ORF Transcript_6310/g.10475 Transcript_6310/m.10475 type:complete len:83 (-) Transcript_6310:352-600(-)